MWYQLLCRLSQSSGTRVTVARAQAWVYEELAGSYREERHQALAERAAWRVGPALAADWLQGRAGGRAEAVGPPPLWGWGYACVLVFLHLCDALN